MRIFRRKKVNFENKNLIICKMVILLERGSDFEIANKLSGRNEWKTKDIPEKRILIIGRKCKKFYEPDGSKAYYNFDYLPPKKDERGEKVVISCGDLIQYTDCLKFTEEEKRTKTITIERIKELEDLLNN